MNSVVIHDTPSRKKLIKCKHNSLQQKQPFSLPHKLKSLSRQDSVLFDVHLPPFTKQSSSRKVHINDLNNLPISQCFFLEISFRMLK